MDNEIYDYIKNGITIKGTPIDGYTVFTIPTQHFKIDSLHQLIPETFENAIKRQKEIDETTSEMLSQIYHEPIDWGDFVVDELYKRYSITSGMTGQVESLTKEEFITKIKTDDEFYKLWGENCCIELTYEERYNYWFSHNFETGMEYYPQHVPDFDNDYYEPTPKRKLKE